MTRPQVETLDGIAVWGEPEIGAIDQMRNCLKHDDVVGAALMADHYLGYAVPVGGVIAYGEHVSFWGPQQSTQQIASPTRELISISCSASGDPAKRAGICDRLH
jgi:tRNA-splicing ligase RtcB